MSKVNRDFLLTSYQRKEPLVLVLTLLIMAAKLSLNSLLPEIKLMIFDNIHDFDTLSSIVHASPQYHQIYQIYRRQILSQVTIEDFFRRTKSEVLALSELLPYTKTPSDTTPDWVEIRAAIHAKASQANKQGLSFISKPRHQLVLSIDQSLALLRCRHLSYSQYRTYGIRTYFDFYHEGSVTLKGREGPDYVFVGGVEGLEHWFIWVKAGVDKIHWHIGYV